ncbi:SDR family NAD(P)-dependent oxidoreductase [Bacteroides hominis]|uniref:SDR family NAD(P)-dependent oxidoreductase n=1 Tax=Bacteroides TaxID=816 RepID=UPI003529C567
MKKVIIIGATSGIGRGLAERFIQEGNMVGITGRRENKLQELCSQNKNCFYTISDVTKETDTIRQLNNLVDRMGGMDILVFCSGVGELNPELDYNLERATLLTNVIGFTNVADWAFHFFQKQESGHLVTISSVGGMRGEGIAPAYNASKAYQINYTEGLRKKAAKLSYPIHITDIRPGFVDTAMAKGEGLFWVTPLQKAVQQIYRAIFRKRKVVYISRRWRYVAMLLRIMPASIYCKM